jgi:hypothetical protein
MEKSDGTMAPTKREMPSYSITLYNTESVHVGQKHGISDPEVSRRHVTLVKGKEFPWISDF